MKTRIEVSSEMETYVGIGPLPPCDLLNGTIVFSFDLRRATFAFSPDPAGVRDIKDADVVLVVTTDACRRTFGSVPEAAAVWHLPNDMRSIALAIADCATEDNASNTLRLAKSIELLCVTYNRINDGSLIPADGAGALSASEAQRIAAARRLIDEHWSEKLTLQSISRSCGLNRAKLTRGFRAMFAMSVGDAILERRLGGARQLLLATDLPVSSIGYQCGYQNNASFSRAFSRRFGQTPSHFRTGRLAA
jgi:AraC family transcriptional activator of pyochelin receptor